MGNSRIRLRFGDRHIGTGANPLLLPAQISSQIDPQFLFKAS